MKLFIFALFLLIMAVQVAVFARRTVSQVWNHQPSTHRKVSKKSPLARHAKRATSSIRRTHYGEKEIIR